MEITVLWCYIGLLSLYETKVRFSCKLLGDVFSKPFGINFSKRSIVTSNQIATSNQRWVQRKRRFFCYYFLVFSFAHQNICLSDRGGAVSGVGRGKNGGLWMVSSSMMQTNHVPPSLPRLVYPSTCLLHSLTCVYCQGVVVLFVTVRRVFQVVRILPVEPLRNSHDSR